MGRWRQDGLWYEPTLIEPLDNDSEIVQREVFGPVLTYQTFADEEEAVALANSTAYGLSGIVYTGSEERSERIGRAIRAGTIWVNTYLVRDLTAPSEGSGSRAWDGRAATMRSTSTGPQDCPGQPGSARER